MQPRENINPRAELIKSAPVHKAQAISEGVINFPLATILILSRRRCFLMIFIAIGRTSFIGRPTESIKLDGAAPVPPPPPSITI